MSYNQAEYIQWHLCARRNLAGLHEGRPHLIARREWPLRGVYFVRSKARAWPTALIRGSISSVRGSDDSTQGSRTAQCNRGFAGYQPGGVAVAKSTYLANRLEQSSGSFRHRPDQATRGGTIRRVANSQVIRRQRTSNDVFPTADAHLSWCH